MKLDYNHIYSNSLSIKDPVLPIIYFLIKDGSIVYVGQSTRGISRVFQHGKKDFDRYYYFDCDTKQLSECEAMYIAKFKPLHNKRLPTNSLWASKKETIDALRNKYEGREGIGCRAMRIIDFLKIPTVTMGPSKYYSMPFINRLSSNTIGSYFDRR